MIVTLVIEDTLKEQPPLNIGYRQEEEKVFEEWRQEQRMILSRTLFSIYLQHRHMIISCFSLILGEFMLKEFMSYLKRQEPREEEVLKNVLNLQTDESIAAVLRLVYITDDDGNDITFSNDSGFILFATKSGKIKKTAVNDFRNYRKDGIIAIKLDEGNELIDVRLTSGIGRRGSRYEKWP